jgi:hypothetical protein
MTSILVSSIVNASRLVNVRLILSNGAVGSVLVMHMTAFQAQFLTHRFQRTKKMKGERCRRSESNYRLIERKPRTSNDMLLQLS